MKWTIKMKPECKDYYTVSGIFDANQPLTMLLEELSKTGISGDQINIMMSDTTLFQTDIIRTLKSIPLTRINDIIAAGPIVSALADSEPGVGLVGVLVESGIPVYEAKSYYQKLATAGPVIIMVHALAGNEGTITDLFKQCNGKDIFSQVDLLNIC